LHGGQAGADVEELSDAGLRGEVVDGSDDELPGLLGQLHDAGEPGNARVPGNTVGGAVFLAAHPVVPDPRRMRHRRVNL
jgi:hypothetical protein